MGDFSEYRNRSFFSCKRKHNKEIDMKKVRAEALLLRNYINSYHISLVSLSRDIAPEGERNKLFNAAKFITNEKSLINYYKKNKVMPILKIGKATNIDLVKLKRYIDYLKLYTVLLMDNKFNEILKYLNLQTNNVNLRILPVSNSDDKQAAYKGIGIDISKYAKSIFILTRQGIVADVEYSNAGGIGTEILAKKYKYIPIWIKFAGVIALLMFLGGIILNRVFSISDTKVVLKTSSEINLDVNSSGKVISVSSPTEKGKEMIASEEFEGNSLDTVLVEILEYADENDMIPADDIINMAITSEDFNLKSLSQTTNFVQGQYSDDDDKESDFFKLVINNAGTEKVIKAEKDKNKEK